MRQWPAFLGQERCPHGKHSPLSFYISHCKQITLRQLNEPTMKPTFGGHEKFVFRHGWLKKGIDGVIADPAIFSSEDALVALGVGKNMVRSIRHWCLATQMAEEEGHPLRSVRPTDLGRRLLRDDGWDPHLEDTGTMWLIHWLLCTDRVRALVWQLAFSRFYEPEFNKRQLVAFLAQQFQRLNVRTTAGTIDREVDCFLRTYVLSTRTQAAAVSEESLDCPLVELDLIRFDPEDAVYRFVVGAKASLPVEVFGYALLDFLSGFASNRSTVAVDDCVYQEGSPGQIFRLDENSVMEYLEEIAGLNDSYVRIDETSGLRQLYLSAEHNDGISAFQSELLRRYYDRG